MLRRYRKFTFFLGYLVREISEYQNQQINLSWELFVNVNSYFTSISKTRTIIFHDAKIDNYLKLTQLTPYQNS